MLSFVIALGKRPGEIHQKHTATTQHLTRKHTEIRQLNHHQNKTERPSTKMVQKPLHKQQHANNRIHQHTRKGLPQNGQTQNTI